MRKNYLFLVLVLVFSSVSLQAQDKATKRAYRKGKIYYDRHDFIRASPFLKEAYNLSPDNATYAFMAGKSVYLGDQPREALKYLIAAYNIDRGVDKEIEYYLARSLHHNGILDEAIMHYEADLANAEEGSERRRDTETRIQQCKNGPAVLAKPVSYKIENLGEFVNTSYPEYASTFTGDYAYMIYTTRRPRKISQIVRRRYHVEDINEEVYEASLVNGTWMRSRIFTKPIPRRQHDASIALSADGNTLIYYVDNRNYGDVYISKREEGGKWSKRESIGQNINTEKYNEPSVFISMDGKELYWVSDKPEGKGMKDIYISILNPTDGTWGEGQSLGANINTPYDEDAPFLSGDGKKLYFSSRGHNSIGGYDLFVCDRLPNGAWSDPKNLGYPINSFSDDIYIVQEEGGNGFFFTSDRPGGFGEKDIYYATPSAPSEQPNATMIAGVVTDKNTGQPLAAEVRLLDSETNEVIATTNADAKTGSYKFVLPQCGETYRIDVKVPAGTGLAEPKIGKLNVVSGRIEDAVTGTPLNAIVELVDPNTNKVVDQVTTNPNTGNYVFAVESGRNYMLRVRSDEYLPYYQDFGVTPTGELSSHYAEIGLQKQNESNKLVITWQFFDVDRSVIKQDYYGDLDNVVTVLKKVPDMNINIIGHTDSDASEEYNQKLSEDRAQAVADYLVQKGIDAQRLNVSGMGETMPIYANDGKFKNWNRRVELFLIPKK